ncbi:MAG: methyltransferase domain-containing protein [Promethearchaeota archaeon]
MSKIGSDVWKTDSVEKEWRERYLSQLNMLKAQSEFMEERLSLLDFSSAEKVLEIGCGLGNDALILIKHLKEGGKYLGVDVNPEYVEKANALFRNENLTDTACAETADAMTMPMMPNYYDIVMIVRVLEHLTDPASLLKRVFEMLKPGGELLCIEPDFATVSFNHPDIALTTRIMNSYFLDVLNYGTAGSKLREWFVNAGFKIKEIKSSSHILLDYNFANLGLGLERTVWGYIVKTGKATQEEATRFIEGLKQMSEKDIFFGTMTMITFVGKKPLEK